MSRISQHYDIASVILYTKYPHFPLYKIVTTGGLYILFSRFFNDWLSEHTCPAPYDREREREARFQVLVYIAECSATDTSGPQLNQ